MIIICFLCILTINSASSTRSLRNALHDNEQTRTLFQQHLPPFLQNGLGDSKFRLQIFRRSLIDAVAINEGTTSYEAGINFFSYLTEEERNQYLGFNISRVLENVQIDSYKNNAANVVSEINWIKSGHVTYVSDQGMCGSCWAFAGVGALETRYVLSSGTLKKFSEQESLDCVYDRNEKNGCRGGQYFHQFDWIIKTQHQALAEQYKYQGKVLPCRKSWYPNALTHSKLTSQLRTQQTNDGLAAALLSGAVAVGLKVVKELNLYKTGIFVKKDCGTPANHAVTAVGYTAEYFILKNSWGKHWGDHGFIKFSRQIENMCDIALWGGFPDLERTNDSPDLVMTSTCRDKRKDCANRQAECGHGINWKLLGNGCKKTCGLCGCRDAMEGCKEWAENGYCSKPNYKDYMKMYCPLSCHRCVGVQPNFEEEDKTCADKVDERTCRSYKLQSYCTRFPTFMRERCLKTCGFCENQCPVGLTYCDGECKHVHMCSD